MKVKYPVSVVLIATLLTGCAQMDQTQQGTATGAGIGAALGGILGATVGRGGAGNAVAGAAVGGILGAVTGNVWSSRLEAQRQTMERATEGTGVQVTRTEDNLLKIEIPSDISFDTGKSDIKSNFRPILDKFAQTLKDNPNALVTIIGHTDNTGNDAINDPLSLARAEHARNYLIDRGITYGRFKVAGRGSHEPLVDNSTAANRAKNRRVEIYVADPTSTQN